MQKNLLALCPKLFIGIILVIPAEMRIFAMCICSDIFPVGCNFVIQVETVIAVFQALQVQLLQILLQLVICIFFPPIRVVWRKLINHQRSRIRDRIEYELLIAAQYFFSRTK